MPTPLMPADDLDEVRLHVPDGGVEVAVAGTGPTGPTWSFSGGQPAAAPDRSTAIPLGHERVPLVQRAFEIVVALIALVVFAPVMLVVAIVVAMGTPGPVLFRQERLGVNGRPFRFVKFRTMYADARERFPHLYAYRYSDRQLRELRFKVEVDPRVTPQGQWLRRLTVDELPNFWSVLTGDMALVGPRPEIPEMLPYYHGAMLRKFTVRPGITGLAQVSGRGRLGFKETVDLDVQYVNERSLWLDVKILLKTIRIVAFGDGAF